jgi:hypothetical protein
VAEGSNVEALPRAAMRPLHGASRRPSCCGWADPSATVPFLFFKYFSNGFEFEPVKRSLVLLKKFQIKCRRVGIEIRNKFPHWSFSKFGTEFELKVRGTN